MAWCKAAGSLHINHGGCGRIAYVRCGKFYFILFFFLYIKRVPAKGEKKLSIKNIPLVGGIVSLGGGRPRWVTVWRVIRFVC